MVAGSTNLIIPTNIAPSNSESVSIEALVGGVTFGVLTIVTVMIIVSIILVLRARKEQPPHPDGAVYDEVGPPELPPHKSTEVAMELNVAYGSNIQVKPNAAYDNVHPNAGTDTGTCSAVAGDYYVNEGLGPNASLVGSYS